MLQPIKHHTLGRFSIWKVKSIKAVDSRVDDDDDDGEDQDLLRPDFINIFRNMLHILASLWLNSALYHITPNEIYINKCIRHKKLT